MVGELLDHYRVLSKIGEGGMGVVYRARDEILKRDVALKVLADTPLVRQLGKDRLLLEARASSGLNHPNICTVHQIFEVAGQFCLAMELVEGESLHARIGDTGLPVESVLRFGGQFASGLAHAHGRNIVHRDLKSSNIVVTPDGLIKILDFGLARRLTSDAAADVTVSIDAGDDSASLTGTLAYMAPEVLRGEPADTRSDLWALGVVLYEAVSGQLPFQGKTTFEITSAILNDVPIPLPSQSRIPPSL